MHVLSADAAKLVDVLSPVNHVRDVGLYIRANCQVTIQAKWYKYMLLLLFSSFSSNRSKALASMVRQNFKNKPSAALPAVLTASDLNSCSL